MFRIFDKYLFRKVINSFFQILIIVIILFIILDLVGNGFPVFYEVQDFLRFLGYYLLFFDTTAGLFMPLFLFGAGVVTLCSIDLNHELIALKTMGISSVRIAMPLIVAVVVLSASLNGVRECIIPTQVAYLSLPRNDYVHHTEELGVERVLDDQEHFYILGEKMNLAEGRMSKVQIMLKKESNSLRNKMTAESATYLQPEGNRPSGWLLEEVSIPDSFLEDYAQKISAGEKVVFSPLFDENGIFKKQVFVSTHITPLHLVAGNKWFFYGKLHDLYLAINDPTFRKNRTDLVISVHTRIFRFLTDIMPFLLGVLFYLNRGMSDKVGKKILYSLNLPVLFVLMQFAFSELGSKFEVPVVAVCGPLLFLPVIAVLFYLMLRKEI